MAINKKLIFWKSSTFNPPTSPSDTTKDVLWNSIVFFDSTAGTYANSIWTHGKVFSSGVWGTNQTNYVPLAIGNTTYNLSKDGHTHSYLPLSGGTLTGQINLTTTTITTPPANTIALAAKSDGLYQKIGTVETKLALTTDLTWANITSNPTTVAGYGITDAVTLNTDQKITGLKGFAKGTLIDRSYALNPTSIRRDAGVLTRWSSTSSMVIIEIDDTVKRDGWMKIKIHQNYVNVAHYLELGLYDSGFNATYINNHPTQPDVINMVRWGYNANGKLCIILNDGTLSLFYPEIYVEEFHYSNENAVNNPIVMYFTDDISTFTNLQTFPLSHRNAATATLASTLTINSSASTSWFDILWNSGTTVYGSASNKLRVQPSTGSITSGGTITASDLTVTGKVSKLTDYQTQASTFDFTDTKVIQNIKGLYAFTTINGYIAIGLPKTTNTMPDITVTIADYGSKDIVKYRIQGYWYGSYWHRNGNKTIVEASSSINPELLKVTLAADQTGNPYILIGTPTTKFHSRININLDEIKLKYVGQSDVAWQNSANYTISQGITDVTGWSLLTAAVDVVANKDWVISNYSPLSNPTFTGTVTAPTFIGALTGNASSATNLSRSIVAGTGLSGGGKLDANRTISFDTVWGDNRYDYTKFGLGTTGRRSSQMGASSENVDLIPRSVSGFIFLGNNDEGSPTTDYPVGLHIGLNSNISGQLLIARSGRTFVRGSAGSSVWNSWKQLAFTDDNITGNATTATTATNLSRSILAGNGLTGGGVLNADRTITLGTPGTLSNSTTNSVTTASHTHSIDPSDFSVNSLMNTMLTTTTPAVVGSINYGRFHSVNAGNLPVSNNANAILTMSRHTGNYDSQLAFSSNGNIYYRDFSNEVLNNTKVWKTIAFTTNNVASATKLETSRTIWGQSFDGSGNVTGAFSGATTGVFSSTVQATTTILTNLTTSYLPKQTASGLANSMIYDNGTNVGIGTTNPGVKLGVAGQARFQSSSFPVVDIIRDTGAGGSSIYGGAKLERLTTSPTNNGGIGFYFKYPNSTGVSTYAGMFGGALSNITNGAEIGDIVFGAAWQGADPASKKHLIIRATGATTGDVLIPNGNVGIGTTNPTATLDVNGTGKFKDDILMTFNTWTHATDKNSLKKFLNLFDIDTAGNLVVDDNLTVGKYTIATHGIYYNSPGHVDKLIATYDPSTWNYYYGGASVAISNYGEISAGAYRTWSGTSSQLLVANGTVIDKSELTTYAAETITNPSGTLTLKLATETVITNTLTSSDSISISLPSPTSGRVNESILIFKIGASIPTITQPSGIVYRISVPALAINSTWTFVYEQVWNGSSWEIYCSTAKNV